MYYNFAFDHKHGFSRNLSDIANLLGIFCEISIRYRSTFSKYLKFVIINKKRA